AFAGLSQQHELTMFGRTYAAGFETDLDDWLLRRPRRAALTPAWPWAIWYPLRRTGAFGRLSPQEQGAVIHEHSVLGRAYGDADLAHDVRLACHGLDVHDNDFVIGLVGRELHPLSHLVQAMRKTVQTSQSIQPSGPFFVGHALWQSRFGRSGSPHFQRRTQWLRRRFPPGSSPCSSATPSSSTATWLSASAS